MRGVMRRSRIQVAAIVVVIIVVMVVAAAAAYSSPGKRERGIHRHVFWLLGGGFSRCFNQSMLSWIAVFRVLLEYEFCIYNS